MRAAVLVRRAEEDVAAERLDVDRLVRGVVDGVDPAERAGGVRQLGDARDVGDRPHGVRRGDTRDDTHAVVELPLEIVEVEAKLGSDVDPLHLEAAICGDLDPRRDATVVVEPGDENPVALLPVAGRGAREHEVERRHIRAEDHVVR